MANNLLVRRMCPEAPDVIDRFLELVIHHASTNASLAWDDLSGPMERTSILGSLDELKHEVTNHWSRFQQKAYEKQQRVDELVKRIGEVM